MTRNFHSKRRENLEYLFKMSYLRYNKLGFTVSTHIHPYPYDRMNHQKVARCQRLIPNPPTPLNLSTLLTLSKIGMPRLRSMYDCPLLSSHLQITHLAHQGEILRVRIVSLILQLLTQLLGSLNHFRVNLVKHYFITGRIEWRATGL